MSALHVLITGELWKNPATRTAKNGKPYGTALIRSGTPTEGLWCHVVAFDQAPQTELSRLQAGDIVTVQGSAKISLYEKNNEHRAGLDVTAAHVLALRQPQRTKPKQAATAQSNDRRAPSLAPEYDDQIPF
jgi:single-stranded DNA-binding protein